MTCRGHSNETAVNETANETAVKETTVNETVVNKTVDNSSRAAVNRSSERSRSERIGARLRTYNIQRQSQQSRDTSARCCRSANREHTHTHTNCLCTRARSQQTNQRRGDQRATATRAIGMNACACKHTISSRARWAASGAGAPGAPQKESLPEHLTASPLPCKVHRPSSYGNPALPTPPCWRIKFAEIWSSPQHWASSIILLNWFGWANRFEIDIIGKRCFKPVWFMPRGAKPVWLQVSCTISLANRFEKLNRFKTSTKPV